VISRVSGMVIQSELQTYIQQVGEQLIFKPYETCCDDHFPWPQHIILLKLVIIKTKTLYYDILAFLKSPGTRVDAVSSRSRRLVMPWF